MATKTFKIGLSNTDKQNMAQDVYERLLALTFPEYDTSTSYSVGDFVVYNDQLYKCIGATTGAWDSTKWQLATLNDLVTDIEDAVAFVNDKANVDGNYPTMTVGVADQLSPYDEESGDDQEEPFSFQATGTGNGTQPDFSTGAIALMKEKQGNSVVVNQLASPYGSTETKDGITFTRNDDGSYTISGTASADTSKAIATCNSIAGHKYLLFGCPASGSLSTYYLYDGYFAEIDVGGGVIYQTTSSHLMPIQIVVKNGTAISTPVTIKPYLIDLTQWFGSNDNIPADLLAHPENFFRYYQGSLAYNAGELVNANGRYVKCIGRNQFDGEWTQNKYYDSSDGELHTDARFQVSGLIKVVPNTDYAFCMIGDDLSGWGTSAQRRIVEFDKDQNFITESYVDNQTLPFGTPFVRKVGANTCYVAIEIYCTQVTKPEAKAVLSIYYEGESGYDQYYQYEVLTNTDTGAEVLRSAGSVADIKLPDGTIKRNVGTYTFTGNETVYYSNEYDFFTVACAINGVSYTTNVIIVGYDPVVSISDDRWTQIDGNGAGIRLANHSLSGDTSSLLTSLVGKSFNYELATPTTEQGTPYSENIVIDDFGSMDFSGTNGVPQGNLIFYPVDYKAFLDTLYNYTEGTPSNIALKSDLSGLVAQEDLSSGITDENANLTFLTKKVYKTGNIVVVTIIADTTNSINASTTLLKLPSGAYGGNTMWFNCFTRNTSSGTNENVAMYVGASAGDIQSSEQLDSNTRVFIELTFAVA